MPDTHYENPRLAEVYDFGNGWSVDREFYLSLAGPLRQSILDLGCGTGLICETYAAKGHDVTGADPSLAMLNVGRRRLHGSKIDWVQSSAQNFQSEKRFDLIIMTGHVFQVLLEDSDILACFTSMHRHLKPEGRIVFESRNPRIDWKKIWDYDIALELPEGSIRESRRFLAANGDRMTFELRYEFPDATLVSKSELRFLSRKEIENRLAAAGLHIEKTLGDWDGRSFDEMHSHEMIFTACAPR